MKKFVGTAALTASAVLLFGGVTSGGTAAAETPCRPDHQRARTTGAIPNDVAQQVNKNIGAVTDTTACTVEQANDGLNNAGDEEGLPAAV